MSSRFNPKWIAGKTVERVEMNGIQLPDASRVGVLHKPVIYFTDGSTLAFRVEESDSWAYGVDLVYTPKR